MPGVDETDEVRSTCPTAPGTAPSSAGKVTKLHCSDCSGGLHDVLHVTYQKIDDMMSRRDVPIVRKVMELLQGVKQGVQDAGDLLRRHVLAFALISVAHPITTVIPWSQLIAPADAVLSVNHLLDIGPEVRAFFQCRQYAHGCPTSSCDCKSVSNDHGKGSKSRDRVMQYVLYCSLPRIKHSRVQFPSHASRSDMIQLLQITFAMLLGIIPGSVMQPTWRIHVLLTVYMLELTSKTHKEMFAWCQQHFSIIRLAFLEYYFYFVSTYMPVEHKLQTFALFDCDLQTGNDCDFCLMADTHTCSTCCRLCQSVATGRVASNLTQRGCDSNTVNESLHRQVVIAIDQVRQLTLQGQDIDWTRTRDRCALAIEKCNRITRNKRCQVSSSQCSCAPPNQIANTRRSCSCEGLDKESITREEVVLCKSLPSATHAFYLINQRLITPRQALITLRLSNMLQVYDLPSAIADTHRQIMNVRHQTLGEMEKNRSRYYVCLLCTLKNQKQEHRVQLLCTGGGEGVPDEDTTSEIKVLCMTCNSFETMLYVDLIGRIMLLRGVWYYFCMHCQTVHRYRAQGIELFGYVHCQLNQHCCYHISGKTTELRQKRIVREYQRATETPHASGHSELHHSHIGVTPSSHVIRQRMHEFLGASNMAPLTYTVLSTRIISKTDDRGGITQQQHTHTPHSKCMVCDKTFQLNTHYVLDDYLGLMQEIPLCAKHSPFPHQMKLVYNLQTMVSAINMKRSVHGMRS